MPSAPNSSSAQSTPSQLLADSTTSPGTERFGGAMIDDDSKREKEAMLGYHGAMDSDDTVESLVLGIHGRHSESGRITPFTPQQNGSGDGEEEHSRTLEQVLAKNKEIGIAIISFLDQRSFVAAHRICRLFMYCARFPRSRSHLMIRVAKMGDELPIPGMLRVQ